jgi:hypothetical protein
MFKKKHGKTIKLFLMDADPEGRIICELSNWTGKAYRIPRGKVKDCANRPELKSTAVYILFGRPESSSGKSRAYIGEAENAYNRLVQHVSEKEFWNEAVVFISKDENLNKAHIKYLESRLYDMATSADRFQIENGNTPTKSSISEPDQAEMEEFIEYVRMLINTMNFKVFEPLVKEESEESAKSEELYIKGARGALGSGKRTADGFVVFKGSEMATSTVPSFPRGFDTLREEIINSAVNDNEKDKLILDADVLFSSPSSAAAVIMGRSANGLLEWKNESGKTLKEIEASEIEKASNAINTDS